eukprot:jgi/Phyca11/108071/e_gw1.14.456.1
MKVLFSIAAIAALLTPIQGFSGRCAAKGPDNMLERSGVLTADFTQKACAAAAGTIDPNRKGNLKCCYVPDYRHGVFIGWCNQQKAGNNFKNFHPTLETC